ncbi:hypothetical protein BpHYR1_045818 [Brachionus plicatilis]|uniref:Uncharacterized protein n=1 Tax=Brachionus plicatilis TaxID=10195 RepID=A0A3M7SZB9_BRAPC|nr:hypothetical protein BpHYR1_045818 [Brachionus plicatilis]
MTSVLAIDSNRLKNNFSIDFKIDQKIHVYVTILNWASNYFKNESVTHQSKCSNKEKKTSKSPYFNILSKVLKAILDLENFFVLNRMRNQTFNK